MAVSDLKCITELRKLSHNDFCGCLEAEDGARSDVEAVGDIESSI
jgi:hypothetical protein